MDITSTASDLRSSTESTSSVADIPPDGKEEDIQENSVGQDTAIGDIVLMEGMKGGPTWLAVARGQTTKPPPVDPNAKTAQLKSIIKRI